MVFQDFRLLKDRNVFENVAFAQREVGTSQKTIRESVPEMLKLVGLSAKYKSLPQHLSGGEQQRVAIARALINRPEVLLADEPTGNLDSKTERTVVGLLKKMALKYGTSIVLVTHNERLKKEADRIIRLEDGEIIQNDETAQAHGTIQNNEVRMVIDRWTAENF